MDQYLKMLNKSNINVKFRNSENVSASQSDSSIKAKT